MKFKDDFIETIKRSKANDFNLHGKGMHNPYGSKLQWWHIIELEEDDFDKVISIALTFRPDTYSNGNIADKYIKYKNEYFNGSIDEYSLRLELNPDYFIKFFEAALCKRKQEPTRDRIKKHIKNDFADSNILLLDTYNEIVEAYVNYFKCQRDIEELPTRLEEAEQNKKEAEQKLSSAIFAKEEECATSAK